MWAPCGDRALGLACPSRPGGAQTPEPTPAELSWQGRNSSLEAFFRSIGGL